MTIILVFKVLFLLIHMADSSIWTRTEGIRFLEFANAAYCKNSVSTWSCPFCNSTSSDFNTYSAPYDISQDIFGYVGSSKSQNLIVAAYRGTETLTNWITDLNIAKTDDSFPFYPASARIHRFVSDCHRFCSPLSPSPYPHLEWDRVNGCAAMI